MQPAYNLALFVRCLRVIEFSEHNEFRIIDTLKANIKRTLIPLGSKPGKTCAEQSLECRTKSLGPF